MSVRHAIFPVAGLGTRFLPATKALPKEMLPVVDKPLIQYAVEEAYAAGVREMIFVTGRHKRAIEDHFDTHLRARGSAREGEQGRAAAHRARGQAGRHGVRLRAPGAGARPRPRGAVRAPRGRRRSVRGAAARRPDDRQAADPGADGRAVRRAGSASIIAVQEVPRRAHPPLRHRRRHAGRRPPGRHQPVSSRSRRPRSRRRGSASPAATC